MKRSVAARMVLALVAVLVWGYGYRYDLANVRLVAIAILMVSLASRFAPARWFGDDERPSRD